MSSLVPVLTSNAVFAAGLSLLAIVLTKIWRNPHLAHALWALVLLKLITPPFAPVTVPERWLETSSSVQSIEENDPAATALPSLANRSLTDSPRSPIEVTPIVDLTRQEPVAEASAAADVVASHPPQSDRLGSRREVVSGLDVVGMVWATAAVAAVCLLIWRCFRFRRLLVSAEDADDETIATVAEMSERLGLRRRPPVRTVTAPIPPLVWCLGWRPVVLLPVSLLKVLEPAQRRAVIAHELAHIRRGDHWMRWLEVLATVAFWWYPVVWLARRRLREAEEECCDAWVVWALPAERRSYGQAMLKAIEFLTDGPAVPTLAGSAFGRSYYQRRFEMIMQQNRNRKASWAALLTAGLLAVVVLPLAAQTEKKTGDYGASSKSSNLLDSVSTQASESSWELGLEFSRPAGLQSDQQAVKQQTVATQRRALAALQQLAEESLLLAESESPPSVDAVKVKELLAELEKIQKQVDALKSSQQSVDDATLDNLQFTKPQDPRQAPDATSTPSLKAVWERITRLELLLNDLQKAQADGLQRGVDPADSAAAESATTIRDRITLDSAISSRLPSFEVSSHEDEQQLQERLLKLDVESAKRALIAGQRSVERLAELGDVVSAKEVNEERDALLEKEIQLQRAETVLELFQLKAKRRRDERAKQDAQQSRIGRPSYNSKSHGFIAPTRTKRLVRVTLLDAKSKPIPDATLMLDGTSKDSHSLRQSKQTDDNGRIDFPHWSTADDFELSLRLKDAESFEFVDETVPLTNLGDAKTVEITVRYDGKQAEVVAVTKPKDKSRSQEQDSF